MNKYIPIHFCFLTLVVLAACSSPEKLDETALKEYLNDADNGLTVENEVNDLNIRFQYKPNDLLVAQELRSVKNPTSSDLENARDKYRPFQYWILSISKNGTEPLHNLKSDPAHFNEVLQNLSFRMNEFVHLTTEDQDTIPLSDFMYSRMFSSSAANSVLLAFPSEKVVNSGNLQMHLADVGFGTGKQRFQFLAKNLERVPSLIIDSDLEDQVYAINDE